NRPEAGEIALLRYWSHMESVSPRQDIGLIEPERLANQLGGRIAVRDVECGHARLPAGGRLTGSAANSREPIARVDALPRPVSPREARSSLAESRTPRPALAGRTMIRVERRHPGRRSFARARSRSDSQEAP